MDVNNDHLREMIDRLFEGMFCNLYKDTERILRRLESELAREK